MPDSNLPDSLDPKAHGLLFELMNEVGIIAQLSRSLLEARLDEGMTIHHFTALNHMVRLGDGQTPMALASAFQVPRTSMSHTLAGLEKRGLVEMVPNPDDGRGKRVMLTAAGRALRTRAIAALDPDFAAIVPLFGPQQATELMPGLRRLREILDQRRHSQ